MALFRVTAMAEWFYAAAALLLVWRLSEGRRNDFLKSSFPRYFALRLVENLLAAAAFIVFLITRAEFLAAAVLLILSAALAFVRSGRMVSIVIPTPFSRRPFEFCVGFRSSFLFIGLAYFCGAMAVAHDNYNVGLAALGLLWVVILSYYVKLESEYYVWSFAMSARRFLLEKMKIAWLYSAILSAPIILMLGVSWPDRIGWALLLMICGAACVATMIAAKYSSFPHGIGLPAGVILLVSLSFPPLLLVAFPMFYLRAVRELTTILK